MLGANSVPAKSAGKRNSPDQITGPNGPKDDGSKCPGTQAPLRRSRGLAPRCARFCLRRPLGRDFPSLRHRLLRAACHRGRCLPLPGSRCRCDTRRPPGIALRLRRRLLAAGPLCLDLLPGLRRWPRRCTGPGGDPPACRLAGLATRLPGRSLGRRRRRWRFLPLFDIYGTIFRQRIARGGRDENRAYPAGRCRFHRGLHHRNQPRLQPRRERGGFARPFFKTVAESSPGAARGGYRFGEARKSHATMPKGGSGALPRRAFAGGNNETMGAMGPFGPSGVCEAGGKWLQKIKRQGLGLLGSAGPPVPATDLPAPPQAYPRGDSFPFFGSFSSETGAGQAIFRNGNDVEE
jgi:hypothetical protein